MQFWLGFRFEYIIVLKESLHFIRNWFILQVTFFTLTLEQTKSSLYEQLYEDMNFSHTKMWLIPKYLKGYFTPKLTEH